MRRLGGDTKSAKCQRAGLTKTQLTELLETQSSSDEEYTIVREAIRVRGVTPIKGEIAYMSLGNSGQMCWSRALISDLFYT